MFNSLTRSMAWLHTWAGVLTGILLFSIFFTGTLTVFDREITRWMQPALHVLSSFRAQTCLWALVPAAIPGLTVYIPLARTVPRCWEWPA